MTTVKGKCLHHLSALLPEGSRARENAKRDLWKKLKLRLHEVVCERDEHTMGKCFFGAISWMRPDATELDVEGDQEFMEKNRQRVAEAAERREIDAQRTKINKLNFWRRNRS